jgi:hypothetical protein
MVTALSLAIGQIYFLKPVLLVTFYEDNTFPFYFKFLGIFATLRDEGRLKNCR